MTWIVRGDKMTVRASDEKALLDMIEMRARYGWVPFSISPPPGPELMEKIKKAVNG